VTSDFTAHNFIHAPHDTEFLGTIHQNEWGRAEQNRRFDRDVGSFLTGNLRTGMTDEVAGDCKLQQTETEERTNNHQLVTKERPAKASFLPRRN